MAGSRSPTGSVDRRDAGSDEADPPPGGPVRAAGVVPATSRSSTGARSAGSCPIGQDGVPSPGRSLSSRKDGRAADGGVGTVRGRAWARSRPPRKSASDSASFPSSVSVRACACRAPATRPVPVRRVRRRSDESSKGTARSIPDRAWGETGECGARCCRRCLAPQGWDSERPRPHPADTLGIIPGRLAQLGERRLDKAEVTGSSPVSPITKKPC